MHRQKILGIRMDPGKVLKLRITVEALFDDLLGLLAQPLVKVVLWLMSVIAAFLAGLAF
jgi:hypothetical protein